MSVAKALLVSAGGMGCVWADNILANIDVKLVGWVDINSTSAAQAAEKRDLTDIYTGNVFGAALATAKPEFVIDMIVQEAHHDVTLQPSPKTGQGSLAEAVQNLITYFVQSLRGKIYSHHYGTGPCDGRCF